MIYPWQADDWSRLQQLRSHWPHALLLHGQAGIGKLRFAQHLAQGLLCEAQQPNGEPCGHCAACGWFSQGNHPDYRIVVPDALAAERGPASADDSADKADKADGDEGRKTRAPSKEIRIEQVRALLDFSGVGSHRGGMRVVVLYPAEALNVAAANALLKTLEEPPAGVVFPQVELPPHAADLGMSFYNGSQFPKQYVGGIFDAEHGSWARTHPLGARIMFTRLRPDGTAAGTEVFASGWLTDDGQYRGRPVDVEPMKDGSLLVSDDFANAVYRISYVGK